MKLISVRDIRCGIQATVLGVSLFLGHCLPASSVDRPNIILIMADDMSAKELGAYGNTEHKTPELDSLADEGVLFKTCWATPICSPSRAEILTGRYGFRTQWYHNQLKPKPGQEGHNIGISNITFAEALRDAGYATAVAGKWQLPGTPEEYGFDEYRLWALFGYEGFDGPVEGEEAGQTEGGVTGRAARYWHPAVEENGKPVLTTPEDYGPDLYAEFLLEFAKRKKGQPFLLYFPMVLPHISWDFDKEAIGYLPVPEIDGHGRRTGNKLPGSLETNVEYISKLVGRMVRELKEEGLWENSVLLFTSDNGTLGYGKGVLSHERGPRVPMIVAGPSYVKRQGAINTLIDFSDVLPTLCEIGEAELPRSYPIDGWSFADTLRGEPIHEREFIYSYMSDFQMLRNHHWLLDGEDRLFYCGENRDESKYIEVTHSTETEVLNTRKLFEQIRQRLPAPTESEKTNLYEDFRGYRPPFKFPPH